MIMPIVSNSNSLPVSISGPTGILPPPAARANQYANVPLYVKTS